MGLWKHSLLLDKLEYYVVELRSISKAITHVQSNHV